MLHQKAVFGGTTELPSSISEFKGFENYKIFICKQGNFFYWKMSEPIHFQGPGFIKKKLNVKTLAFVVMDFVVKNVCCLGQY